MRALCMVAHPDDCVIFGYHFITNHPHLDWHIAYATYTEDHPRAIEIAAFWKQRRVTTSFLGLPDDKKETDARRSGWDEYLAVHLINEAARNFKLILTHNHKGEYFHVHHQMVHNVMRENEAPKVYFGSFPDLINRIYTLPEVPFDSNDLPLHRERIDAFDLKTWKYFVTPEAEDVLKSTHE